MAELTCNPKLDVTITLKLSESEALALDAISGYDIETFIRTFYEKLGSPYLQPHEDGLRSLFGSVRRLMPSILRRMAKARQIFNDTSDEPSV